MPTFARCFLSSMIWLGLNTPANAEQLSNITSAETIKNDECQSSQPRCLSAEELATDINNTPIKITSDYAQAQVDSRSLYQGDVIIQQGHRTLKADNVTLNEPENIIIAEGNVSFQDGIFSVQSDNMKTNLDTEDSELNNARYKMMCTPGRGEAKKVFKNGTTFYQLENGTYTTCPDEDNSWRFSAGKIEKNDGDIFADLYNPRFEILDTPIFYLPYLRVPVEDGRLTGFLYPSIAVNDSDGIEFETPFYWNIHPQVDALITPRFMSNRGLFMSAEPNYLTEYGQGSMVLEYMGDDRLYPQYNKSWGFNWVHSGIDNHWKYNVDYSKVSDVDYFNRHTDSNVGSREENTLLQTGQLAYRDYNWDATLNLRNFQALGDNISVYRQMPQLAFNYYYSDLPYDLQIKVPTQLSHFTTDSLNKPDATRFNIEPTITLPYNLPWLTASAEGKLLYSYYNQSNIENVVGYNGERLEDDVSRLVPLARLHAMVTLERNSEFLGYNYSQTLEPQMQYLYIEDVDQSNIYNPVNYAGGGFDTARLQTDYYGLFRSNQFSSVDYINPANQVTLGAATRFFDDGYKERFSLAFGQIYYIDLPKDLDETSVNFSAWAIESELNLNDHFFVRGSLEYDSNVNEMQFANATAEYRDSNFFVQSSYRYVSRNYIASTIGSNNLDLITKDGISQIGLSTGLSLTENISMNGEYFYDTTQSMMLEGLVQLTYTSDCWVIGFGYNEYLLARSNINDEARYDNNFTLSFSLLGLGANAGFTSGSASGNVLGYHNPFALKN